LKPASLNGEFINRHKEISQTKKAQTPKPHSMTGADAARLITESDFMDPECQAQYKPTSPTKRRSCAVHRQDISHSFKKPDVDLLSALTPHQVDIHAEAPNKAVIGLHDPQWGYAIARAA
jgi:hypothetical protein